MTSHDDAPHSALYLNDLRDGWWNADYLELLARRLDFAFARDILDVGCGKGHFTRLLAKMAPNAKLTGVDREHEWVEAARASSAPSFTFVQGTAEQLPFADASFDVVACQTVLIHVKDVVAALKEMKRVLRPGGRVVACEPNNLAENFARLVSDPKFDLDDALAFVKLQAICEKGKHALGLGYNSTGESLSGAFARAGLVDVNAWANDRAQLFVPPHDEYARRSLEQDRAVVDDNGLIWPHDETRRYFSAGGGDDAAFDELWTRARRAWSARFSSTYAANEGGLFYVVTGRRSTREG